MNKPFTNREKRMTRRLKNVDIETNLTRRWENGTEHHPKARNLAKEIGALDWLYGNDYLNLKFGGDGDNGEHLTYLLDILFELEDFEKNKGAIQWGTQS